jgi:hypothetical protein
MYSLIVTAKMNDVDPQAWLARPLDVEQGVDPADRPQRQGRDDCRLLALSFATGVLRRSWPSC